MPTTLITQKGTVVERLPSTSFRVKLDVNQKVIFAYTAARVEQRYIKINVGDQVSVEMSPLDWQRGRIVYKHTNKANASKVISKKKK